jgi:hypothetical protein
MAAEDADMRDISEARRPQPGAPSLQDAGNSPVYSPGARSQAAASRRALARGER